MKILPVYAALLALLFVFLSVRTIRMRRRLHIGIGDAENPVMLRAMRVHANFAEYVPMGLLLAFFVETSGAPQLLVHALGASLLVGRIAHAFGVSREPEDFRFRVFGMVLTFTALLLSALYLLAMSLAK